MGPSWQQFFDTHAPHYDQNPFTYHTAEEVQFLLNLYPVPPGAKILDVGCGTGRHAIEFARRGFQVTGVDFSLGMLEVARRKATELNLAVEFIHADAREFTLDVAFDYGICLCEGGIGLLQRGEDPFAHDGAILRNIARHLRPNAPFVMTALNGYSIIRQMKDEHIAEGRFDPASMVAFYVDEWDLPEGTQRVAIYERLLIPPEMTRLMRDSGFAVDNVYGGTAGAWGQRPLSLDEVEAMYIGRRAA
ncbi:MAG: class I SAM-dependent methyltransferase [Fimbriimonadaceae bacterium]|nr:class I SAM-dependent methyltransferase [Fimbriimonadaceae bacterium]